MTRDQGGGVRRRNPRLKDLLPHEVPEKPDWPYGHGKLDRLSKALGLTILVITTSLIAYFRYQQHLKDIVITPLDSPRIIADNATSVQVNPERFWGTYR